MKPWPLPGILMKIEYFNVTVTTVQKARRWDQGDNHFFIGLL